MSLQGLSSTGKKDLSALLTIIQSREPDFKPSSLKQVATVPKVLGLKWKMLTVLLQLIQLLPAAVIFDVLENCVLKSN